MKETPGCIVVNEVLKMKGKFTKNDILDTVVPKIKKYFSNREEMEKYISRKIDTLCEYRLLGKTSIYYFSL